MTTDSRNLGGAVVEKVVIHLECRLRTIVGSASHLLKKCSCYGGQWEDPPELSKREAARLAAEIWHEQNKIGSAAKGRVNS